MNEVEFREVGKHGSLHVFVNGEEIGVAILKNQNGSAFLASVNDALKGARYKSVESAKAKVLRVFGGKK